MQTHIENTDQLFANQIDGFTNKIDTYAITLSLDPKKIATLKQARDFYLFVSAENEKAHQYALGYTAYKNHARRGLEGIAIGPVPTPPVYATPPPPVVNGSVQAIFADMIQDCVRSKAFTPAMAQDLGILKPPTSFDPQAGTPELFVTLAQGGHPLLHTRIGKYESYDVYKDSGAGYIFTGNSQHPDFLDLTALPAQGVSAIWKYKVIYKYAGVQAGNWSNEVIVSVYGSI